MFIFTSILTWLGNLLGGPFAKAAVDAYRAKLSADNTAQRVAADLAARELAVEQRERELGHPRCWWPRRETGLPAGSAPCGPHPS